MKDYYSDDELFEDWIFDLRIPGACRECGEEVAYEGDDDWCCIKCFTQQKTDDLAIPKNRFRKIIDDWHEEYKNSSNPEDEADRRLDDVIERLNMESQQIIEQTNVGLKDSDQLNKNNYTLKRFLWEGIPVFIVAAAIILYFMKPEFYTTVFEKLDRIYVDLREGDIETENDFLEQDKYNVMEQFYADYFNKDPKDLTEQDYEKIKYIKLYNRDCKLFIEASDQISSEFKTNADFEDHIYYWEEKNEDSDNNGKIRVCDLSRLTGLVQIEYSTYDREQFVFADNESISMVKTDANISDICEVFDESQITVLDIKGGNPEMLSGIGQFTKLQSLIVDGRSDLNEGECYNISYLSGCKNLECLRLNSKLSQKGVQILNELTNLKSLYVENLDLKDCAFLQNMPNMENITLENVSDSAGYGYLRSLKNLQSLTINESISLSDLKGLDEIHKLNISIENISQIDTLKEFPELESLTLYIEEWNEEFGDHSDVDISILGELSMLSECVLHIDGCCYGIHGMEHLFNKEGLKRLAIIQNTGMPNPIIIDLNKLDTNNNLEMLDIREIEFKDTDFHEMPVSAVVSSFPSLIRLNLQDVDLKDIVFLSDFSKLEVLGVEDNKISDISALKNVKSLKKIYIGGNDILIEDCPDGVQVEVDHFDFFHSNELIFD